MCSREDTSLNGSICKQEAIDFGPPVTSYDTRQRTLAHHFVAVRAQQIFHKLGLAVAIHQWGLQPQETEHETPQQKKALCVHG